MGGDRCRLLDGEAEPVHAGVDVERGTAGKAGRRNEVIPFGEFDQAVDHRPRIGVDEALSGGMGKSVEHIDHRLARDGAHAPCFGQMRDEEGLAAGAGQRRGDLIDAAAIGVALDHRGAFARRHPGVQHLVVGDDGAKIDGQDAAGFLERRAAGRRGRLGER